MQDIVTASYQNSYREEMSNLLGIDQMSSQELAGRLRHRKRCSCNINQPKFPTIPDKCSGQHDRGQITHRQIWFQRG